jgi:DNA-binding IclR family transcriptional regulator
MDRFADRPSLSDQAGLVLSAIANGPDPLGLRLNDVAAVTGLATAHVGRQLRTLENDRLVGFGAGRWRVTRRGRRVAGALPPAPAPAEAA